MPAAERNNASLKSTNIRSGFTMKLYVVSLIAIMLTACGSSQDEKSGSEPKPTTTASEETQTSGIDVTRVEQIIIQRCATCHSATPSDDTFSIAPGNVVFDSIEDMQNSAARIRARAVDTQTMPFLNKTQMTEAERAIVGAWIIAGAPTE